MSADGYVVIRSSTLAWLLERYREDRAEIPVEVARDLGEAVTGGEVKAPVEEDRLRMMGPILGPEEHAALLQEDQALDLPRGRDAADFWKLVVRITHAMMVNEAEATLRLIGERHGNG